MSIEVKQPAGNEIFYRVQQVIAHYAELDHDIASIKPEEDLFALGMSSRASVGVMLGLESEFDLEFPDTMLRRDIFESMQGITNAITSLMQN